LEGKRKEDRKKDTCSDREEGGGEVGEVGGE
jgi:hypothetical protein